MTLVLLLFSLLVSYLAWFFLDESRRRKSYPPGPPVVPFVGSMASLARADSQPHMALVKLAKKYGDLMRLRLGPYEYVVLSSTEVLNDLLLMDESLGRPTHGALLDRMEVPNIGITFSMGDSWKTKRVWMMRALKETGLGRGSNLEEALRVSVTVAQESLLKDVKKSDRFVCSVDRKMRLCATSNIIWSLLVGSNTTEDIGDCEAFVQASEVWVESAAFGGGLLTVAPFLKHLIPMTTGYAQHMSFLRLGREIGQKLFNKLLLLKGEVPESFFHSYILELKRKRPGFSEVDFRMTFTDILLAAIETTNSYLQCVIFFLTLFPEKQEKLYGEISRNFGSSHVFSISDLRNMPYTQAFMVEVHRIAVVATNWLPRTLTSDINYRGFTIKKDTTLLPNPHMTFKSPVLFAPDSEAFRPERFINPQDPSKLNELRKLVTPFSIGKRVCPGESIAEIVSFLMLVSTVRNFELSSDQSGPPLSQIFQVGLTAKPYPFKVVVTPRQ